MTDSTIDPKQYNHDSLGDNFQTLLSDYDTKRRVQVLTIDFLADLDVKSWKVLDVGCGLGFFSAALKQKGAQVVAFDLGANLLAQVQAKYQIPTVQGDVLQLDKIFPANHFDLIISSECIEHTPNPQMAIKQMTKVLRPGGRLIVSTPNLVWWPVVKLSMLLKVRKFDCLENFLSWPTFQRSFRENGIDILQTKGLHAYPFQFKGHRFSQWLDDHAQFLAPVMINMCLHGQKKT